MKIILQGLIVLSLFACTTTFQENKTERQTILRSKFNQDLPQWVLESANSKIIEESGKTFFVSEIIRNEKSNNTAQLERAASLDASSQLARMAAETINTVIKIQEGEDVKSSSSSFNTVSSTDIQISTIVPVSTYWQLIQYKDNGEKEYHAYAKVRINSEELINAMNRALKQANPNADKKSVDEVIQKSKENMNLSTP